MLPPSPAVRAVPAAPPRPTSAAVRLPPVKVKGKEKELNVFNVIGLRSREWRSETTRPT